MQDCLESAAYQLVHQVSCFLAELLAIRQQLVQLESWEGHPWVFLVACLQNQGWLVEVLQVYLEEHLKSQVWLEVDLLACLVVCEKQESLVEGLKACLEACSSSGLPANPGLREAVLQACLLLLALVGCCHLGGIVV